MNLCVVECRRLREGEEEAWLSLLERKERWSFFQTPAWSSFLCGLLPRCSAYHHRFVFSDGAEAVLPCLALVKRMGIAKLESLPWGTYGDLIALPPLTDAHRREALRALLSIRKPIVEVTKNPLEPEVSTNSAHPIQSKTNQTQVLDLRPGFEFVWESFPPTLRNSVRRAAKEGVIVRWSREASAGQAFKDLYRQACERWKGVETLPLRFFDSLPSLPNESWRIWTAEREGVLCAANLLFYGKNEVQYFAAVRNRASDDPHASKYLMSEILRDACEQGLSHMNFGASGGVAGVEQFKRFFGGQPLHYTQWRVVHPLVRGLV